MCVCTKMKRRGLIAHGPGIKQYLRKLSTFWALSSFSESSKKAFKNSCHGIGVEVLLRTNSLLQGCLRKSDPFALWAGIKCEVLQRSVVGLVLSYPQMIWKVEQTENKICKDATLFRPEPTEADCEEVQKGCSVPVAM